jgi:hypothetical protein
MTSFTSKFCPHNSIQAPRHHVGGAFFNLPFLPTCAKVSRQFRVHIPIVKTQLGKQCQLVVHHYYFYQIIENILHLIINS